MFDRSGWLLIAFYSPATARSAPPHSRRQEQPTALRRPQAVSGPLCQRVSEKKNTNHHRHASSHDQESHNGFRPADPWGRCPWKLTELPNCQGPPLDEHSKEILRETEGEATRLADYWIDTEH